MKTRGVPPWDVTDGLEGDGLDPLPLDHDKRVLARYLSPGRGVGTGGHVHLLLVLPVWTTLQVHRTMESPTHAQVHRTMESPTHAAPNLLPTCSGRCPGPDRLCRGGVTSGPRGGGCGKGAGRGWNPTQHQLRCPPACARGPWQGGVKPGEWEVSGRTGARRGAALRTCPHPGPGLAASPGGYFSSRQDRTHFAY